MVGATSEERGYQSEMEKKKIHVSSKKRTSSRAGERQKIRDDGAGDDYEKDLPDPVREIKLPGVG